MRGVVNRGSVGVVIVCCCCDNCVKSYSCSLLLRMKTFMLHWSSATPSHLLLITESPVLHQAVSYVCGSVSSRVLAKLDPLCRLQLVLSYKLHWAPVSPITVLFQPTLIRPGSDDYCGTLLNWLICLRQWIYRRRRCRETALITGTSPVFVKATICRRFCLSECGGSRECIVVDSVMFGRLALMREVWHLGVRRWTDDESICWENFEARQEEKVLRGCLFVCLFAG